MPVPTPGGTRREAELAAIGRQAAIEARRLPQATQPAALRFVRPGRRL